MLQYNPTISGSLNITGSLIISNGMIGTVNGVDVEIFSSSISQVVTNIQTTTGSQSGRLTSIESFTSSTSARLNSIETISASNLSRINSIEIITSSNVARLNSIETITASNIARLNAVETITASNIARLTSLEITTGSLATTGSNTFIGTQTITGSLFISSNLVVQGTSSLQNITASAVSIGTNIVNLNTANPAIRYAGLSIGDSGSVGGSGSFLYDSVQDEMIFVHRGTSTVVTSSVTLMGPQTYDNVGNETYPTSNYIQKGTGNEHLVDSCIFDNGTTTCIKNNLVGTGTACFGNNITATTTNGGTSAIFINSGVQNSNGIELRGGSAGTAINWKLEKDNTLSNAFQITPSTTNGGTTFSTPAFTLTSAGIGCFLGTVCTPNIVATNLTTTNSICLSGVGSLCFFGNGESKIQGPGTGAFIGLYNIGTIQFNSGGTYDVGSSATTARCIFSTKVSATHLLGTCLTLNGFSSGNGFKMDYGSASGQITAINLMANGTTNGYIGIQMVDGSNGDLWFGSSANRSMTVYRTTGHVGFGIDAPCTRIHAEGGYGSRWGGDGCFYGGGVSGGGMPYGDIYGNGASYTYQTCNGNANNSSLWGGFAAGYFKGGPGSSYGGGGAGIVAIGGDGGNAESVNSGGGAGIFARGGKNGAGSVHSYAGWFDGGDVIIRCGNLGVGSKCTPNAPLDVTSASSSSSGIQQWSYNTGPSSYRLQLNTMVCSGLVRYSFDMLNAGASYNCVLTIDRGTVGIGTGFANGYVLRLSSNSNNNASCAAKLMQIGNDVVNALSGFIYIGSYAGIDWLVGKDTSGQGDYRFNLSLYTGEQRMTVYTNGNYSFAGSNVSDLRLKSNINNLCVNAIDKINQLTPKCYNMDGVMRYGFVAQDVKPILSDLITGEEKEKEYLGLDYNGVLTVAVKAIQEQQCIICSQASMISTLKTCLGIS